MKPATGMLLAALCAACLLSGCTGVLSGIRHDAATDTARANDALARVRAGSNTAHDDDAVVMNNGLWLSGSEVSLGPVAHLPALFGQPASFERSIGSLQAFAARITRLTGVPTEVAAGAQSAAQRALGGNAAGSGPAARTATGGDVPPLPPGMLAGGRTLPGGALQRISEEAPQVQIDYRDGDLKGLLDTVCARLGVSWKFADGRIVFYFTDTKVFQVTSVPGDTKLNADVVSAATNSQGQGGGMAGGGQGTAGGATGGGTASVSSNNTADTNISTQLSVFKSLELSIRSMLSPYGSVVPSPATGSIAVTDTPDVLERVSSFMSEENRVLSRQVLVNVTVLTVTLSKSDNYGINWGAVYQALGSRFGITNTFPTLATNPVQFSASVITPSSRASGTTAMISALSDQGTVRRTTSASVTTLNDQPVPVQVATQQGYLAEISTTSTANVGSQTALTPGTVTTGFNLTLLPHVLDDGTVMLQFYTNLSELLQLQTVSSGGEQIQVPDVETRNFLQRVAIKSGQTLVLSGYEGLYDDGDQQGVGSPANPLFGGGVNASRSREVIVILVTPVLTSGV
jgi:type IVB pilus formation R64 PilN family outer membrane protein